ncbi:hypothetical protein Tco_0166446 [Tanacetum coccineum]
MTVAGARETVGSQVEQQNGYSALTARDLATMQRNAGSTKRVKDYSYHKEKMMMCKQAEQGVPFFMAKIQEVLPEESSSTD